MGHGTQEVSQGFESYRSRGEIGRGEGIKERAGNKGKLSQVLLMLWSYGSLFAIFLSPLLSGQALNAGHLYAVTT